MLMNKEIKISVVVPTFNNAQLLKRCINSVLSQTYKNFELLIIDNYSKDETSEIISLFKDKRISHIKIHNYGIIAKSRNLGIKKSNGEWIAFLDSDDIWYPNRLKKISKFFNTKYRYDLISTNEFMVYENRKIKKRLFYHLNPKDKYKSLLLYGNKLSPSASVVRKEFIIKNSIFFNEDKNFITVEDYDFWLMLALKKAKFKFLKSFEGEYLVHSNNSSSKNNLHNNNLINLIELHTFNIQKFEKNKNNLFKKLINLRKAIIKLQSKQLIGFFSIFIKSPIFIFRVILIKFLFKLKNEFIYLFKNN